MGSFDGFIYNKLPIRYQINGYPESIIWIFLFIGILAISKKYENKKIITILSIIFTSLICIVSVMDFLMA
jgi:amino acid transporter